MITIPFFSELEQAENILIAGAGGGYDVFCGLPLYFGLTKAGKRVHLANFSFSLLTTSEKLSPSMSRVTADTERDFAYFPEQCLAQWFRTVEKQEISIYCFKVLEGVKSLLADYQMLVDKLSLDTIILVDGGTDSLMRGDEDDLGTPYEDMLSIAAVNELKIKRKMLACLGFGVDRFHGVSNDLSFEAIAELTKKKAFLGMFSLVNGTEEAEKYQQAADFVFEQMPKYPSIVSSSILSAFFKFIL